MNIELEIVCAGNGCIRSLIAFLSENSISELFTRTTGESSCIERDWALLDQKQMLCPVCAEKMGIEVE